MQRAGGGAVITARDVEGISIAVAIGSAQRQAEIVIDDVIGAKPETQIADAFLAHQFVLGAAFGDAASGGDSHWAEVVGIAQSRFPDIDLASRRMRPRRQKGQHILALAGSEGQRQLGAKQRRADVLGSRKNVVCGSSSETWASTFGPPAART